MAVLVERSPVYFKRLELIGFKSFANRTVFEFQPGVTAVVGPNGCGKSNISDAIRWVLGEQNPRDLRGKSMEDVIFNGTVDEKAMGMAEVGLTLSNADRLLDIDFEEVTITRRLFRSGESQYLINKKACRLKDVRDLLLGTGMGLDAYSHFEQGAIEQVLSAKPEERRAIFEEAAGIMKYKVDRQAAMRKLEATEENLVRINDIVREVKRQINSLDRQAAKARRHKRLKEELTRYDVAQLLHSRDVLAEELTRLTTEHDEAKSQMRDLFSQIESRDGDIEALRLKLAEQEGEFEALQRDKLELLRAVDHERNTVTLSEQRIADAEAAEVTGREQIEALDQQISALNQEREAGQVEIEAHENELRQAQESLTTQEEQVAEEAAALEQAEATVTDAARRSLELVHRDMKLTNELEVLDRRLDEHRTAGSALVNEQQQLGERRARLEQERDELARRRDALEGETKRARDDAATLRSSLQDITGRLNQDMAQRQQLAREMAEARSQHELLCEMRDNFEGYHYGVKSVLRASAEEGRALPGVYGTVADLLRVPEEFEVAIEAVLGNQLQYIAVATGQDARRAIAFLKETNAGRATFLPYDLLRPRGADRDRLRELIGGNAGLIAPAGDVVTCDDRDRVLVEMLLADTVLVEDFDAALRVAEQKRYRFRLVTRGGEVFSGRGIISGGRTSQRPKGLLSRDKRIAQLEDKAKRLATDHGALHASEQERAREAASVQLRLEEIAGQVRTLDQQATTVAHDLARATASHEAIEDQMRAIEERIVALSDETVRSTARREEVSVAAVALEQEKRIAEQESERRNSTVTALQTGTAQAHRGLTELKVLVSSLNERLASARGQHDRIGRDIEHRNEEINARRQRIESDRVYGGRLREEITRAQEQIEVLSQRKAETERSIEALDERRSEIGNELGAIEAGLKDKRRALHEFQQAESDMNVALTETRLAVERIDERLRSDYGLAHDDPNVERFPDDSNWDEILGQVEALRSKIEAIGPVNLYAIEEYERLEERHTFLVNEQEDLVKAKESLLKAISKINKTSRRLFKETFDKIRESFRGMFTSLFGGGKADLILDDESDVLECGIEIVASPPGKKLQSITLMSGGEKTMTAVCLLFSVFRVKPSPFCILDEMDAALDEPNIVRFNETLQGFVKRSQFIIVTHNKRTIAMADLLYGITMERSGISKVVSVKFRDSLAEPEPAVEAEAVADVPAIEEAPETEEAPQIEDAPLAAEPQPAEEV